MFNNSDLRHYERLETGARKLIDEFTNNNLSQFSESIEQLFSNNLVAEYDTYVDKLFYFVVYLDDFVFQSEHCKQFLKMSKLLALSNGDVKALIETNEAIKNAVVDGIISSNDSRAKSNLNHIIGKLDSAAAQCYLIIDNMKGIPAISFLISPYTIDDSTDADALKAMYFKRITNYGTITYSY